MLTAKEVSKILGVSLPRVYQLDAELEVQFSPRGNKQQARHYRPEVVERVRLQRSTKQAEPRQREPRYWPRLVALAKARAKRVMLSPEDAARIASMTCASCGVAAEPFHALEPVACRGEFDASNLVACCKTCQRMIGDRDVSTLVDQALKIATYQQSGGVE